MLAFRSLLSFTASLVAVVGVMWDMGALLSFLVVLLLLNCKGTKMIDDEGVVVNLGKGGGVFWEGRGNGGFGLWTASEMGQLVIMRNEEKEI